MALGEKPPRKIVDEPKDLVGLALAAGRDFGLLAPGRPDIAQRAPLGKAGFIAKEQQGLCFVVPVVTSLRPSGFGAIAGAWPH